MHFDLVDRVLEQSPERIVTIKHVSLAEEYLQDHFPTFHVLPGVLMLEAMVQAARKLCDAKTHQPTRWVLGEVRTLRYGNFVPPGATLRVEVDLAGTDDDTITFKATASVVDPAAGTDQGAASGRFTMRPLRTKPIP